MEYDYLIESRPLVEKQKLKRKIDDLKKDLRLRNVYKIPHISLIYNFRPKIKNYRLAEIIRDTASEFEDLSFEYCKFDLIQKENGYVFGFKIEPSKHLQEFRYELYQNIKNHIIEEPRKKKFNTHSKDEFWFHSAIAIRLNETTAERIRKFINNEQPKKTLLDKFFSYFKNKENTRIENIRRPLLLSSEIARISIIRSSKIAYEYDVFTHRILKRSEALSKNYKRLSLETYRYQKNIETVSDNVQDSKNQVWLISDTHFDHSNIIDYCARPFADVNEMNNVLVNNWNSTVKKQDKVYFLGDIRFGRGSRPKDYWLNEIKGEIVFIRGDHDDPKWHNMKSYDKLDYKGHKFLLIHDPKDKHPEWNDWIIHGHKHNNDLENYPLINWERKTVNVCAELIKYRPINFDKIIEFIENKKEENVLTL